MSDANEIQREILDEVLIERIGQDQKWGGSEHDDHLRLSQWVFLIDDYNRKARNAVFGGTPAGWRHSMVQIAALAVAAIESFDRRADASADFVEANPGWLGGDTRKEKRDAKL